MKVFLRVVVTILILCALGLGSYFIFFKPADDDVVFLKLSDMLEYKDYKGNDYTTNRRVDEKLQLILDDLNNIEKTEVNFSNNVLNNSDGVSNFKLLMGDGEEDNVNYSNVSCSAINNRLDDIFNYYFAYTQASTKVKKSAQKEINSAVKTYLESYDLLNEKLNMIISLQKAILANSGTDLSVELGNRYALAVTTYYDNMKEYTNLILKVKDYVEKYVFNDTLVVDKDIVENNIYLYVVQSKMSGTGATLSDIAKFSNLNIGNVKMIGPNILKYAGKYYQIETVEIGTGETKTTARVVKIGDNSYYRQNSQGNFLSCNGPADVETPYGFDANEIKLGATIINEHRYVVDNSNLTDSQIIKSDLKTSKLVEHYNYIMENNYFDKLLKVLTANSKVGFMSDSGKVIDIPEICVDSIRYILACYGFCE